LGFDSGLRSTHGEQEMNLFYLITGLITLALFVYLVVALLKPEWFE
jgi:K+-transporting ATPase KdpF subunit